LLSLDSVSVFVEHADAALVLDKIVTELFLSDSKILIRVCTAEWLKEFKEADSLVVVSVNKTIEGHLSSEQLLKTAKVSAGVVIVLPSAKAVVAARSVVVKLSSAATARVAPSSGASVARIVVPVHASEATAIGRCSKVFEILFLEFFIKGSILSVVCDIGPRRFFVILPTALLPLVLLSLATPVIARVPSPSSVVRLPVVLVSVVNGGALSSLESLISALLVEHGVEVFFFIGSSWAHPAEFSQGTIDGVLEVLDTEFILRPVAFIHCVVSLEDFLWDNFSILVSVKQREKSLCSLAIRAQATATPMQTGVPEPVHASPVFSSSN